MLEVPEHRAAVNLADRVCLEQEARHHPEVAATPSQGPEKVWVAEPAGRDEATVGEHNIGLEKVVDG